MTRLVHALALLPGRPAATPAVADPAAWAALREPGSVAVMRHAYAPGVGDPAERLLLVTHHVNITALTGRGTRSGEVVVIRVGRDGAVTTLGSIAIPVP